MNCTLAKTSLFLKQFDTCKHMQLHTALYLQVTGYCRVIFHGTFRLLFYFSHKRLGVWDLVPFKTNYLYHYHQSTPINASQKCRNVEPFSTIQYR